MGTGSRRVLFGGLALGCLLWAGVETRHLEWRRVADLSACGSSVADSAALEQSFAPIQKAINEGDAERALLLLRERTERGPYPTYAWFWLGRLAYREGAFEAAVRHYRRAVEGNPGLADRGGPFQAAETMDRELTALLEGPWRGRRPQQIRDLYFLRRRFGGGCQ